MDLFSDFPLIAKINVELINEYLTILGIPQQKELKNEKNYKKLINKFVAELKQHN